MTDPTSRFPQLGSQLRHLDPVTLDTYQTDQLPNPYHVGRRPRPLSAFGSHSRCTHATSNHSFAVYLGRHLAVLRPSSSTNASSRLRRRSSSVGRPIRHHGSFPGAAPLQSSPTTLAIAERGAWHGYRGGLCLARIGARPLRRRDLRGQDPDAARRWLQPRRTALADRIVSPSGGRGCRRIVANIVKPPRRSQGTTSDQLGSSPDSKSSAKMSAGSPGAQ